MYHDILVCIDASGSSERALSHATELAHILRARLTVLSVSTPVPAFAYRAGIDVGALEHQVEEEAENLVRRAADRSPKDLSLTTRVRHGHPGEEIIRQVGEAGHDLVVLGSRGRGRLAANLLGSVGATVHFHLPVALLVVQPDKGDEDS